MAIDYGEVMAIVGQEMAKHAATTSLLMQTKSLWSGHDAERQQIQAEYARTSKPGQSIFDTGSIILQIMALHPQAEPLLVQTLKMWDGHIGDLIKMLDEIQAAAVEANKT
jgi:hypothetical protein